MTTSMFRGRAALLAAALAAFVTAASVLDGARAPAHAQAQISVEFRPALEPYGRWVSHPRWGEVWVVADRPDGWRPYQVGHWVYTEEWGWYWIADDNEADWGWVTYHYGRWAFDGDLGWVWIPGDEWAPAWVNWRRGSDYVGWAPLPPDPVIVEVEDDPEFWIFVRPRDLVAPRIYTVILPVQQRSVFLRETVLVNRTVTLRDRGPRIAVNAGIPPAFIAAAVGRPLRPYQVRPRVFAGTQGVQGSLIVRSEDLRRRDGGRGGPRVRETATVQTKVTIQPARSVPPPQALEKGGQGRLGDNPPRAARGSAQQQQPAPQGGQPSQQQPAPQGGQPSQQQQQQQQQGQPRVQPEPKQNQLPQQKQQKQEPQQKQQRQEQPARVPQQQGGQPSQQQGGQPQRDSQPQGGRAPLQKEPPRQRQETPPQQKSQPVQREERRQEPSRQEAPRRQEQPQQAPQPSRQPPPQSGGAQPQPKQAPAQKKGPTEPSKKQEETPR